MTTLPVPPAAVTPDNARFFAALAEGRLALPRCGRCATVIWYPRHRCPECGGGDVSWFDASGRGTVYSFTILRRGTGEWASAAPYVLAYVELEEGPRVLTNIVGDDAEHLRIGQAVEMHIEAGEPPLLRFRRA